jgi:hypothetical protein
MFGLIVMLSMTLSGHPLIINKMIKRYVIKNKNFHAFDPMKEKPQHPI